MAPTKPNSKVFITKSYYSLPLKVRIIYKCIVDLKKKPCIELVLNYSLFNT